VTFADRAEVLALVANAVRDGSRQGLACEAVGVDERTLQRWQRPATATDGRHGPLAAPQNKLSVVEREKVLAVAASPEFRDKSPRQIVPTLADRGEYLASESSFYRILTAASQLAHRGRAGPKNRHRPKALEATEPNQVYSWDITFLLSTLRGRYFYLYLFLDIFSRKIVGFRVHDRESMEFSSLLLSEICAQEKIDEAQLTVHADNGGAMKGSTMLATMERLGVMPSFSRPSVSDDNPFSESLFRTLKYCPVFPTKPFESTESATEWVEAFVAWYNGEHLHSGIGFVTPSSRHRGADVAILEKRHIVYEEAKRKNPSRWSKETRNWERVDNVKLNCLKSEGESITTADSRLVG
jgi:transposase InsO family protein